ncbi:MAG TPA: hypothetical protein VK536_01715 [Candidatus Limnocylindrales bacterium]|nr:hypothetical protein [Candidatus Limnocylindrales bacterium]
MVDLFKIGPAPGTTKISSVQSEQDAPQERKKPESAERANALQTGGFPNAPDILELSASFQKMRMEEQELLGIKQALLKTQQDLQLKLVKEIDKKKLAIEALRSEIPTIQNRCRQLGQVLGVDIYK